MFSEVQALVKEEGALFWGLRGGAEIPGNAATRLIASEQGSSGA